MPKFPEAVLERLRSIDHTYVDQRYISEQDIRLYVWFHEHLFNEILNVGGQERGYTFRQRGETCLLIYKATFEGVHQVVFLTASTPIGCIRILFRQFYAEKLRWVSDKYA